VLRCWHVHWLRWHPPTSGPLLSTYDPGSLAQCDTGGDTARHCSLCRCSRAGSETSGQRWQCVVLTTNCNVRVRVSKLLSGTVLSVCDRRLKVLNLARGWCFRLFSILAAGPKLCREAMQQPHLCYTLHASIHTKCCVVRFSGSSTWCCIVPAAEVHRQPFC
jgi:hypothetical protein